jgi:antitoxin component YwqK of YwqJK toxin-antitoxin module
MSSRPISYFCIVFNLALRVAPALADNSPEHAQEDVRERYLPKVEQACDLTLEVEFDGASLRAHDEAIAHDQTDGRNECDEPLRYLWYACQTPAGKAAVGRAQIERIVCRGTDSKVGSFRLAGHTLTVERAAEENAPYERSRRTFESLLHVSLKFGRNGSKNPYHDEDWTDLLSAPTIPTRSMRDYCLVNGKKQIYESNITTRFREKDAKLECWADGEQAVDLAFRNGRKTGYYIQFEPDGKRTRFPYRDDVLDGELKRYERAQLRSVVMYQSGEIQWNKEFHWNGQLKEYSRKVAGGGYAGVTQGEDGKLYSLHCSPNARDDIQLRRLCGFESQVTNQIYDGTGKVNRIETWKDGMLLTQAAGNSDYAPRSQVDFAQGKKHGVERLLGADGKLESTVTWNHGVKDGKESTYAQGGTKVVKVVVWKAGDIGQVTEYFLNGNPKTYELYDRPEHRRVETYWDNGKVRSHYDQVACSHYDMRDWCEDGLLRSFFEDGKSESETQFKLGARNGPSKSWWHNGKLATLEEYVDDRRVRSKRWDETGKLSADEEYEADGSRKQRR